MIPERISHLMDMYREKLAPLGDGVHEKSAAATHVYNMCARMHHLLKEEDMDKAHVWLGFIQCYLWREGIYDLEELKGHNGWRDDQNEPPKVYSDVKEHQDVGTVHGVSSTSRDPVHGGGS